MTLSDDASTPLECHTGHSGPLFPNTGFPGHRHKTAITRVYFASRQLAESLDGRPDIAIISITDPGTPDARLSDNFHSILRLQFFDAVPADEYLPAPHGLFDRIMAREVSNFVQALGASEQPVGVLVHCEYGISRSAAVALFVEAWSGAPLEAREFACEANEWVIDRLLDLHPDLEIETPPKTAIHDRRAKPRLS